MHTWEEPRFPGGFVEIVQEKTQFSLQNQHFGEFILTIAILLIFLPAIAFPKKVFLSLVPVLIGFLEAIGHTVAIWTFDQKSPYTSGLFNALTLMLPVSIYAIRYIVKNKQVKVVDFGLAFATMFII